MKFIKEDVMAFTGKDDRPVIVIINTPENYKPGVYRYDMKRVDVKCPPNSFRIWVRPVEVDGETEGWHRAAFLEYLTGEQVDRVIDRYKQPL